MSNVKFDNGLGIYELNKFLEFYNVCSKNKLFFYNNFIECVRSYLGLIDINTELFKKINFVLCFYSQYKYVFTDDSFNSPCHIDEIIESAGKKYVRTNIIVDDFDEFLNDFKVYLRYANDIKKDIEKNKRMVLRAKFGLNEKGYKKISKNEYFFEIDRDYEFPYSVVYVYMKKGELFYSLYNIDNCKLMVEISDKVNENLIKFIPIELIKELGLEENLI